METYKGLVFLFTKHEMYESVLLLCEHVFIKINKEIETNQNNNYLADSLSLEYFIFHFLKSLSHLKYHERVIEFLRNNTFLLKYNEIKNLFYFSLSESKSTVIHQFLGNLEVPDQQSNLEGLNDKITKFIFDEESLTHYYRGLVGVFVQNTNDLVISFEKDCKQLQVLMFLLENYLITPENFDKLIDSVEDAFFKSLYKQLFMKIDKNFLSNYKKNLIFNEPFILMSPFTSLKIAIYYYQTKNKLKLLELSNSMMVNLPNDYRTHLTTGLFYLNDKNNNKALSSLQDALKINDGPGIIHFYMSIPYYKLDDMEKFVHHMKIAKDKMIGSYKPSLITAILCEESSIIDDTRAYYFNAIYIDSTPVAILSTCSSLLILGQFEKAAHYLKMAYDKSECFSSRDYELYNVMTILIQLFRKAYDEAEELITNFESSKYKIPLTALLKHLTGDKEGAFSLFFESMSQFEDFDSALCYLSSLGSMKNITKSETSRTNDIVDFYELICPIYPIDNNFLSA